MANKFLTTIFGDPNKKILADLAINAEKMNTFESAIEKLSDEELKNKTSEFKGKLAGGATLDDILHEAFAVVRETAKRTLGQRHYDVQMQGGIAMHQGKIAEMRTGEGKTLTSTLPVYLNALAGKGVHVITVNDYLAKRDAVWMGQIFAYHGLTVGVIQHESGYLYDEHFTAETEADEKRDETGSFQIQMDFLRPASRKDAYNADVTYGTNNQFGFDYLRDNMATSEEGIVQRELNFAIIDEIDSILIDEARTPLIISAPAEESADLYFKFDGIIKDLKENDDFNIDEKMRVATFTDAGLTKVEKRLGVDNLYSGSGFELIHHAEQALKAHAIFSIDKDYVVVNGEVKIVDEFTGRIMEGRRYSDGLHQAIEAKEGVEIKRESKTLATITFQNFFRMYKKLSGMTGTAATEEEEFSTIYGLDVVVVPTNKPIARVDKSDLIYKTEKGKFLAVIRDVKERVEKGQPVLIGTSSIEKNELFDTLLTQAGIPHEMLNAKNHEREAQIVAQAGKAGAVTVATNMAGRGVDIVLGGNPVNKDEQNRIKELGGLYVIGTERHESRRIDNQLRGRAGRQGDPGETRFYVSTDDDLMRVFSSDRVRSVMDALKIDEETPIESKMITKSLEKAQERVEGHHFDARKRVLEYDDVLNKHRTAIYNRRREVLTDKEFDVSKDLTEMVESEVERVVLFHTGESGAVDVPVEFNEEGVAKKGDWDPNEIVEVFNTIVPLNTVLASTIKNELKEISKDKEVLAEQRTVVIEGVMNLVKAKIAEIKEQFETPEQFSQVGRTVLLRTIDNSWVSHLETMTYLRRSIGLQGYGQRDPLVEYKREAFGIYNAMQDSVEREVVYNIFKVLTQSLTAQKLLKMAPSILENAGVKFSGAQKTMEKKSVAAIAKTLQQGELAKTGRNDDCPCGSGKKFKKCHGAV